MTSSRELKYETLQHAKAAATTPTTFTTFLYYLSLLLPKREKMNHEWARSLELFGIANTNETLFVTQVFM
jgi:hypothetical protein